jgi:hypothetical protein
MSTTKPHGNKRYTPADIEDRLEETVAAKRAKHYARPESAKLFSVVYSVDVGGDDFHLTQVNGVRTIPYGLHRARRLDSTGPFDEVWFVTPLPTTPTAALATEEYPASDDGVVAPPLDPKRRSISLFGG